MMRNGSVFRKKRDVQSLTKSPEFINRVVEFYRENPITSLKEASESLGVSPSTIWKVLRKCRKFKPYKCQMHQKLEGGDPAARAQFCEDLLQHFNQDPTMKSKILWTDECLFPLNGIFNKHNVR